MRHKLKLTLSEKLRACLDLSDFILNITRNVMSKSEFNKKLKRLRKKHLKEDYTLLRNFGRATQ